MEIKNRDKCANAIYLKFIDEKSTKKDKDNFKKLSKEFEEEAYKDFFLKKANNLMYVQNITTIILNINVIKENNIKPLDFFRESSFKLFPKYWTTTITNFEEEQNILSKKKEANTNVICKNCNTQNVYVHQKQTRSADESITCFYNCLNCMKSWRIN